MKAIFRILSAAAVSAATIVPAAGEAPFWTAICRGQIDASYSQTVGGSGVFNTGNGDGTYVTWPLAQVFYKPDVLLCSAVKGSAQVAQVCADNVGQKIVLKLRDPKHPQAPLKSQDYCRALVKIH